MKSVLKYYLIITYCFASILLYTATAAPQTKGAYKNFTLTKQDSATVKSRLSWSTDLLDWALMTSNLGFEIDLGDPTILSTPSLFFQVKYRPTGEDPIGKQKWDQQVFTYLSGKAELRWHFRLTEKNSSRRGLQRPALKLRDLAHFSEKGKQKLEDETTHVVHTTVNQQPEMIQGRWYIGVFGEFVDYTQYTKFDLFDRGKIKDGYAAIGGISAGYTFPAFNYWGRRFLQWEIGASVGCVYSPYDVYNYKGQVLQEKRIIPMVSDLRVALTYGTWNISRRYWRPDNSIYDRNEEYNKDIDLRINEYTKIIDSIPVNIIVHHPETYDNDSLFKEIIKIQDVIAAIRQQTGLKELQIKNFSAGQATVFPIFGKNLREDYEVNYAFEKKVSSYASDMIETDTLRIPFRIRLEGHDDADSLRTHFEDSVKSWRKNNGTYPTIYAEAKDKLSFKDPVSIDTIAAFFSDIVRENINRNHITGLYKVESSDYLPVEEADLLTPGLYAMSLRFHPQIYLGEEETTTRFRIEHKDRNKIGNIYNNYLVPFFNSGKRLYIERSWTGNDTLAYPISKEEIIKAFAAYPEDSVDFITENMIEMDTIQTFGNSHRITINYNVLVNAIDFRIVVEDSVGKTAARMLGDSIMANGRNTFGRDLKKYPIVKAPKVDGEFQITKEAVAQALSDSLGFEIKPYQIYQTIDQKNGIREIGNATGIFRTIARLRLHREDNKIIPVPYKIVEATDETTTPVKEEENASLSN